MAEAKNLAGQRFGRLLVLEDSGERTRCKRVIWLCLCGCGNIVKVRADCLRIEHTKSCGCLRREMTSELGKKHHKGNLKHGDWGKRLYRIWQGVISRCYNSKTHDYKYYGKRGIQICDKWRRSYLAFKNWALKSGYQENLVIDRIDNNGNYEPNNCQWITQVENLKKSHLERR